MDRVTDWGCDVANQVPADVASRAAAVTTASYRSRNAGSAAPAASSAGSTRRNSSMGLCWVRLHSTGSSRRNSARALRFQLHDRLAAMAASRLMRSGSSRCVMTRKLTTRASRPSSERKDDPHVLELGELAGRELVQPGRPAALASPFLDRLQDAEQCQLAAEIALVERSGEDRLVHALQLGEREAPR